MLKCANGGEAAARALIDLGVDTVFTLTGGHLNHIHQILEKSPVRLVATRHEQAATFMGDAYARKEVTHPTRIVTTTVQVAGGTAPVVSVKTAQDIPKGKIFDCAAALRDVRVQAPVAIGDVVLSDAAGTGVDVVATKAVATR